MTERMNPEDVLTIQDFYTLIKDGDFLTNSPAHKRQLLAICLEILDYDQIVPNYYVKKGTQITRNYGERINHNEYPNQWDIDRRRALNSVADRDKDTTEASTSSKTKGA